MAEISQFEGHAVAKHGPVFVPGVIFKIEQPSDKDFEVTEVEEQDSNLEPPLARKAHHFDIPIGPLRFVGYFDDQTYEISVTVYVFRVKIGTFVGNVKNGLSINVNTLLVKGSIKISIKNGREVWVHVDLTIAGKKVVEEFKIFPR